MNRNYAFAALSGAIAAVIGTAAYWGILLFATGNTTHNAPTHMALAAMFMALFAGFALAALTADPDQQTGNCPEKNAADAC